MKFFFNAISTKAGSSDKATYFGLLFLMLLAGVLETELSDRIPNSHFSPDSANYIEQARNISGGNGFSALPYSITEYEGAVVSDKLFPPGYPLLIAAVAAGTGVTERNASAIVVWFSMALLPAAVFWMLVRNFSPMWSAGLATLSCFSRAVIWLGKDAGTDIVGLLLVVISTGLLVRAHVDRESRRAPWFALAAGLVGGFAYLVRNAMLAYLLASFLTLMAFSVLAGCVAVYRRIQFLVYWAVGCAVFLAPLLIRNYLVFGAFQPYSMPPSTITLATNVRTFVGVQVADVVGWPFLWFLIRWNWLYVSVSVLAGMVLLGLNLARVRDYVRSGGALYLLAGFYVVFGAGVVVAARSMYEWGEVISARHIMQYTPFVLVLIAALVRPLCLRFSLGGVLAVCLFMGLLAPRSISVSNALNGRKDYQVENERVIAATLEGPVSCEKSAGHLVVSNYAYLFRIYCGATALHFPIGLPPATSVLDFLRAIPGRHVGSDAFVYVFSGQGAPVVLEFSQADEAAARTLGWQLLSKSTELVALRRAP